MCKRERDTERGGERENEREGGRERERVMGGERERQTETYLALSKGELVKVCVLARYLVSCCCKRTHAVVREHILGLCTCPYLFPVVVREHML